MKKMKLKLLFIIILVINLTGCVSGISPVDSDDQTHKYEHAPLSGHFDISFSVIESGLSSYDIQLKDGVVFSDFSNDSIVDISDFDAYFKDKDGNKTDLLTDYYLVKFEIISDRAEAVVRFIYSGMEYDSRYDFVLKGHIKVKATSSSQDYDAVYTVQENIIGSQFYTTHGCDFGTGSLYSDFERIKGTNNYAYLAANFDVGGEILMLCDPKYPAPDELPYTIGVPEGITARLCLNGHSIDLNGNTITNNGTLYIYDCKEDTDHAHYFVNDDGWKETDTVTENVLYGGLIKNGHIINNGTLVIGNGNFVLNSASNGGAIENNGTLIIDDANFAYNNADENGGAIINNGSLTVSDSTFINNSCGLKGGAIYSSENIEIGGKLTIKDNKNTDTNDNLFMNCGYLTTDTDQYDSTSEIHLEFNTYGKLLENGYQNNNCFISDNLNALITSRFNDEFSRYDYFISLPDINEINGHDAETVEYIENKCSSLNIHINGMDLIDVKGITSIDSNTDYSNIIVANDINQSDIIETDEILQYGTDYSIEPGSIRIIIKDTYLNTLSPGNYKFIASIKDVYDVVRDFQVSVNVKKEVYRVVNTCVH